MINQLIKFLLTNDKTLYRGDLDDAIYNLSRAGSGAVGELAEDYYANRFNTTKMTKNFKGYDLLNGYEIKTCRRGENRSTATINGLKHKSDAERIVILWDDAKFKMIKELIVTPDELRHVDGTLRNTVDITITFEKRFADRIKIVAEY